MLAEKRRIVLARTPLEVRGITLSRGVTEFPVSGDVGIDAAALPGFHPDPADRIIAATARRHGATLVTADETILRWPGPLERMDARL